MLKKILVPIDGTEYSWRAMEYAASLAKLSGGHLVILTVVKPGIKAVGGAPLEEELVYSANGPVMQIGNEVLGAAKHLMDKQEIPCDYLLAIGSRAAEEIIKLSRRENCDSIVIGSRGFGALASVILLFLNARPVVSERSEFRRSVIDKARRPTEATGSTIPITGDELVTK